MTDRSEDGAHSPGQHGQEQPKGGHGDATPPPQLQAAQGELRHRPEADQCHPPSSHSELLDAGPVASQPRQLPGTQASSSEPPLHPTPTDPPAASTSTAPTAGAISAASSIAGRTPTLQIIDRGPVRSLASPEPSSAPSIGVATPIDHPHQLHPKSIRPFVQAVMAFEKGRKFSTGTSVHRKRQMSTVTEKEGQFGPHLTTLYLGISAVFSDDHTAVVALAIHDTVYLVDYSVKHIILDDAMKMGADLIADYVISEVEKYEHENFSKFIGAGLPTTLKYMSPTLCSRLWLELDIVPIVMRPDDEHKEKSFWDVKRVDEQADSMARKCIMNFGPSLVPLLQVGWRGVVQTDAGFRAHLTTVQNHKDTCGSATWETMLTYAKKLRGNKTKIAFFSSTPQGGGVALMRHALVRFARLMGVDLTWYVPKPRPGVFRITKNIHNILQGVSHPDQRISAEEKQAIIDWITDNANRYWFSEGGPLRTPEEGGADVVIIDDPQMPGLIPLIKKTTPNRPVLYRSHIQIRSDLVAKAGTPQADIWDFLWSNIQGCDMFISHPIPIFVPHTVPREKVVYLPATTDWLDGLNKPLNQWDSGYYGNLYNVACHTQRMTELNWPARKYIIQVARFDPSKGIPTVIDSYAEFRRRCEKANIADVPQLVVCGNGSVDDPDASLIYDQTMSQLETYYPDLIKDVSVMRLDPNDQLINTLLANAHVVLQLSTREGFEVKVSEALHAGRPVIVSATGGIPLQVKDKVNGFLVNPGDWKAVAGHLIDLFTDNELWKRMSHAARTGVSDEVGTVGNALAWFYLAAKWNEVGVEKHGKGGLKGNEKWVNDMAREEAGFPYADGENCLPRHFTQTKDVKELPVHPRPAA
ncbi:glycosyltransferase family 4 protein [Parathielavia appendiculata]|uniref:Glycosyltransferase family 4 protein n=1 Tax=Parathielavia appendiculata TaxID=2587402 RepID=A0AAN6TUB7_9PEZI|nr:glycosyltransferase family 4 protein [Parathielavia appendiculata]